MSQIAAAIQKLELKVTELRTQNAALIAERDALKISVENLTAQAMDDSDRSAVNGVEQFLA